MSNFVSKRELGDPLGDPLVVVDYRNDPCVQTLPDLLVFVGVGLVLLTYPSRACNENIVITTLYMFGKLLVFFKFLMVR